MPNRRCQLSQIGALHLYNPNRGSQVQVRHLQLANFRNYKQIELELSPGRLLFLGDNAQGKSNLLEAVHLLSAAKSSRARTDSEMIGWQADSGSQPFARISAEVERSSDMLPLELVVVGGGGTPDGASAQRPGKRYRVKGIPRRAVDFVGQLRAVLFTADDLDLISGPPSLRRQFLDSALSQIDRAYYAALQRYSRVMQQRNASLRRIRDGSASVDELSLWDTTFAQEGATIIAARQRALVKLTETAASAHQELAGNANEALQLTYQPKLGDEWRRLLEPDAESKDVQPLFAAALAAQRRREIAAGLCLAGPHRDDFDIAINGVSAASFGSRAQIRTAALAMRLAEARLVMAGSTDPPVLLLDDIVSELDERRRSSVLTSLSGFEQVWFTATSGSWLPEAFMADCHVYEVSSGQVRPA